MAFMAELRKRKVFQVAIGYLAVAWLVVQVAATILPAFDLPGWVLRLIVLLFALGLPIALLLAWALELTSDGIRLDMRKDGAKRMLAIVLALVVLALGWYVRGALLPQPPAAATVAVPPPRPTTGVERNEVPKRGIAVLPFANATRDPDQQFFSDGLSENLIDSLSRFDGLKVIGRISAFQFRDSKDDSAAIGRKLGVAYLLGGSVQRADDVVRINASLTNAADGSTLWAEHYDRPYENLFALQDEIALAVAGALRVKLLSPGSAAKQDDRPPSGNIEAYNAYLRGLKYWHDESFATAAQHMAKAVDLDPDYAMAWALLSGSSSTVAAFSNGPPAVVRKQMRTARLAADRALQLAPGLGPAHAARAYLQFYSFDFQDASAECRRALQLAPDDGTVLNGCGYTLTGIGKLGEAIRLREHLLSIEPLYIVNYQQYAGLLIATGRLDEAEKYLRTAESMPQTNPDWHSSTIFFRMSAAVARGDAGAAMDIATQAPTKSRNLFIALAAQAGSDRTVADTALATLLRDKAFAESHSYWIAQAYALRGDTGHAVEWLERTPTHEFLFLLADPLILGLRDDPRFIAFCTKIGLPPPSESEALSVEQIRALSSKRQARS